MEHPIHQARTLLLGLCCFAHFCATAQTDAPDAVKEICGNMVFARTVPNGLGTHVELGLLDPASGALQKSIRAMLDTLTMERFVKDAAIHNDTTTSDADSIAIEKRYTFEAGELKFTYKDLADTCAGADTTGCRDYIAGLRKKLTEKLKTVLRSFDLPGRVKENEGMFKSLMKYHLEALVPTGTSCPAPTRDAAVSEFISSYFWTSITVMVPDPTPVSNTLCIHRRVPIREQRSALDVWVRMQVEKNPWLPDGLVILPPDKKTGVHMIDSLWKAVREEAKKEKPDTTKIKGWQTEIRSINNTHEGMLLRFRIRDFKYKYKHGTIKEVTIEAMIPMDTYRSMTFTNRPRYAKSVKWMYTRSIQSADKETFLVDRAQFKFESGSIHSVDVHGHIEGTNTEVRFSNAESPIPYAHSLDEFRERLDRIPLYSILPRDPIDVPPGMDYVMALSNLISNLPEFMLNTGNTAPGDTVVTYTFSDETPNAGDKACAQLRREDTRQLFEFKVFHDPIGLAKGKPNGLVQTEMSRRLLLLAPRAYRFNGIKYVEPSLRIQLMEEEERSMYLGDRLAGSANGPRTVKAMEQLNKASYDFDLRLNIGDLTAHHWDSQFELNAICGFHSTRISDSTLIASVDSGYVYSASIDTATGEAVLDSTKVIRQGTTRTFNDLGSMNSFTYGAELRWKIKPDGRFGCDLYGGVMHYVLLGDKSACETDLYRYDRFPSIAFAGIDGWFKPNRYDKWFFRAKWTGDADKPQNHFFQLQLGYNRRLNFKTR